MEDLKSYVGPLLVIMGVALQFIVRARKSNNELVYAGWAVGLCTLVYVLTGWPFHEAWNVAIVKGLVWLGDPTEGALIRVLGGTQLTSVVANMAVSTGKINAASAMVPVTDSK